MKVLPYMQNKVSWLGIFNISADLFHSKERIRRRLDISYREWGNTYGYFNRHQLTQDGWFNGRYSRDCRILGRKKLELGLRDSSSRRCRYIMRHHARVTYVSFSKWCAAANRAYWKSWFIYPWYLRTQNFRWRLACFAVKGRRWWKMYSPSGYRIITA